MLTETHTRTHHDNSVVERTLAGKPFKERAFVLFPLLQINSGVQVSVSDDLWEIPGTGAVTENKGVKGSGCDQFTAALHWFCAVLVLCLVVDCAQLALGYHLFK